ncbi:MAG: CoA transferase [Clostridiales Family XIII bacterium]|jgi:formyl-CoA transferase|nr:CoA transferase [Clostridiales Family XIII bacterium]
MIARALEGLTVVDLSRILAGPYCTMILADMGADVIKVEIPNVGDDSRAFPPFVGDESVYFKNMNRNKRGITLNLKSERGKELFLKLIKKADVLVENYRPGTMEKLGLGYDELKEVNPRLVYGCVSGFGHSGRYSKRAGYDIIGQAMSGIMSVTGWPDGEPTRTGGPISDTMAGLSLACGIIAACRYRDVTGIGQKVDIALVDTLVSSMQIINQIYLAGGRLPERIGNRYESTYPYDTFGTKNGGTVVIGCANDKIWRIICGLMGREELISDPRMETNKLRVENHALIRPIVSEWTHTMDAKELVDLLLDNGCPAAPIYDIAQVADDPHIAGDRDMFPEMEYPRVGKLRVTGSHFKMSETEAGPRFPAPDLGQHNREVYSGLLGLGDEEIDKLMEDGTI